MMQQPLLRASNSGATSILLDRSPSNVVVVEDPSGEDGMLMVSGLPYVEDSDVLIEGDYKWTPNKNAYVNTRPFSRQEIFRGVHNPPHQIPNLEDDGMPEKDIQVYIWCIGQKPDTVRDDARLEKLHDLQVARAERDRCIRLVQQQGRKLDEAKALQVFLEQTFETAQEKWDAVRRVGDPTEVNTDSLLHIASCWQDQVPPLHHRWTHRESPSLGVITWTKESKRFLSHTAPPCHSFLPNRNRLLDVHSARLRIEHLNQQAGFHLVRNGKLVNQFWIRIDNGIKNGQQQPLFLYGRPSNGEISRYMFCRVMSIDSHARQLALVLANVGSFAVHTSSSWIQGVQLWQDGGEGAAAWFLAHSICFTLLVQAVWFLVSVKDAYDDWRVNPDVVHGLACSQKLLSWASFTALKAFDLPHHLACAPTAYHYKKMSLPWAQLKVKDMRAWVVGYPIEAMKTVENHANGTWAQRCQLALSLTTFVIQVLIKCTYNREPSTSESTIWWICTAGSAALLYSSFQQFQKDTEDMNIAYTEIQKVIDSTNGQKGCSAHYESAMNVKRLVFGTRGE